MRFVILDVDNNNPLNMPASSKNEGDYNFGGCHYLGRMSLKSSASTRPTKVCDRAAENGGTFSRQALNPTNQVQLVMIYSCDIKKGIHV